MSYASSDAGNRTFHDEHGRSWLVERVGRTSGIVSGDSDRGFPEPADIVRFRCGQDEQEPDRETTLKAGLFESASVADLRRLLSEARKLRI